MSVRRWLEAAIFWICICTAAALTTATHITTAADTVSDSISTVSSTAPSCSNPELTQLLEEVLEQADLSIENFYFDTVGACGSKRLGTEMFSNTSSGSDAAAQPGKQRRLDEDPEDRFFGKMTAWMDKKLEAQAQQHIQAVTNSVRAEMAPVIADVAEIKTEQHAQGQRLSSLEREHVRLRQEYEADKAERAKLAAQQASINSSSGSPFAPTMFRAGTSTTVPSSIGYQDEEQHKFIAGTWKGVPTDAAIEELQTEANKVKPPVDFVYIEGRRPTTNFLYFVAKAMPSRDTRAAGWALSSHLKKVRKLPLGAKPGDVDKFGRPLILWCAPKKQGGELTPQQSAAEGERAFVNLIRRFLHLARESYNIPEDYLSFGYSVPVIGGNNNGADKHIGCALRILRREATPAAEIPTVVSGRLKSPGLILP
eukprot:TRINITY_DN4121_c0_g1_i2.p1 TRINITY_DN4121_c0_g1~~TRINITY_DN4121_c0_g1_i2.p1  ORF type:complete len:425 (+),score=81.24 TRINITY_DN4121_c0_g1_i2:162-1436(+)